MCAEKYNEKREREKKILIVSGSLYSAVPIILNFKFNNENLVIHAKNGDSLYWLRVARVLTSAIHIEIEDNLK